MPDREQPWTHAQLNDAQYVALISTVHQRRYEIATGDPLQHKETNTLVYVHSVNRFHAASVETARSMIMLLRPSVLAVQLHNDMAPGIVDAARQRLAMISGPEHVHQIADGYQRVCLGTRLHRLP